MADLEFKIDKNWVNPFEKPGRKIVKMEMENSRAKRKLDRILQRIFEVGYYDAAPKWYWLAVEKTLMRIDDIMKYVPSDDLDDFLEYDDFENIYEDKIELKDIEIYVGSDKLSELPVIGRCWKLLDIFFDKVEHYNLFYIRLGLIHIFSEIYYEFEKDYS